MAHKFAIGEIVEFKPTGMNVGLFKVVRRMPEEFQAPDWRYRIKSDRESFERNAWEYDLALPALAGQLYAAPKPIRNSGRHH